MNELALFAGAGGGILGGKLLGWRTLCAVEIEESCRGTLAQRQDDGILEPFPIWDDVRTFDGKPWMGTVDVVSGGFPCTDISVAGYQAGISGEHSGLWGHMARIIGEVRPCYAFVENSPALTYLGGVRVIADLAGMGYDCRWGVMGARHAQAHHKRDRIWILAHPKRGPRKGALRWRNLGMGRKWKYVPWDESPQSALSRLRGVDDGVARVVDRTNAIRNGQVPAVVRLAWETLKP